MDEREEVVKDDIELRAAVNLLKCEGYLDNLEAINDREHKLSWLSTTCLLVVARAFIADQRKNSIEDKPKPPPSALGSNR